MPILTAERDRRNSGEGCGKIPELEGLVVVRGR